MKSVDAEVDRLMALLDIGIDAARHGDLGVAQMVAAEALKTAERMPKKPDVIALPDRSHEVVD